MTRERQWYRASAAEVFDQLGSRKDAGLTVAEVQQRLLEYGANELTRAHVSAREVFAAQFKNLLIVILIIAVVLSAILGRGATHRRIGSVGILSPARR